MMEMEFGIWNLETEDSQNFRDIKVIKIQKADIQVEGKKRIKKLRL